MGSVTVPRGTCAYADRDVSLDHPALGMLRAYGLPVYRDWGDFRLDAGSAEVVVCVLSQLCGPTWDSLLRLRKQQRALTMMLVAAHSRDNTKALATVAFDEFLLLDDVSEAALAAKIDGLTCRATTRLAAVSLRENKFGLDAEVAATLARACASVQPTRSVRDLACIMGYSSSQLERRWQRCLPPTSKPHDFIQWLRLMQALRMRARTRAAWTDIASELGVQQRTLSMNAKRLFGTDLTHLVQVERGQLVNKLWEILGIKESLAVL